MADNPTEVLVRKLGKDQSKEVTDWLKALLILERQVCQSADELYDIVRSQGASRRLTRYISDIDAAINAKTDR